MFSQKKNPPKKTTIRRVVVPVRISFMDQIELFIFETVCVQIELLVLDNNTRNHLTVCKQ